MATSQTHNTATQLCNAPFIEQGISFQTCSTCSRPDQVPNTTQSCEIIISFHRHTLWSKSFSMPIGLKVPFLSIPDSDVERLSTVDILSSGYAMSYSQFVEHMGTSLQPQMAPLWTTALILFL
jgi:hypothetical protein